MAVAAVTVAFTAPKNTILLAGVVLKFVPVIVTVEPIAPEVGANEVKVGGGIKVKPAFVIVPPGVVTLTLPEAPEPTMAAIFVDETIVNELADVPPKLTAVVPIKFVPIMVSGVPIIADAGAKEEMEGAGGVVYVKPAKLAVPAPGTYTPILPVVPELTIAVMLVAETNEVE